MNQRSRLLYDLYVFDKNSNRVPVFFCIFCFKKYGNSHVYRLLQVGETDPSCAMTDYSARGGGQPCVVGLHDDEAGSSNHRRRRSDYDEYSEGCYDDDDQDEDDNDDDKTCCLCMRCPAQLFTSLLLGLLACVLVTGGVFLAFYKWDHTWLLVTAVGVILMAIGTAMHCCSSQANRKQSSSHRCKGGCAGGVTGGTRNHHHSNHKGNEIVNNGSVLTEQLLPLSNARSVSQLSLNMVPGYFPPLVYSAGGAPYSLEQHSAVVQNISRLVQHQTQLHLQHAGAVTQTNTDGAKSFILVPLPSQGANTTSLQNIVAAVCQLEAANASADNGQDSQAMDGAPPGTSLSPSVVYENCNNNTVASVQQQSTECISLPQPSHKHVEVQTCNEWNPPNQLQNEAKSVVIISTDATNASSSGIEITSTATAEFLCQTLETTVPSTNSPEINDTVMEEVIVSQVPCEQGSTENQLLAETSESSPTNSNNSITCDNLSLIASSTENGAESITVVADCQMETPVEAAINNNSSEEILQQSAAVSSDVLCNITESCTSVCPSPASMNIRDNENVLTSNVLQNDDDAQNSIQNSVDIISEATVSVPSEVNLSGSSVELAEGENAMAEGLAPSSASSDFDDTEFIDRSSPPPSYEDVAHETSCAAVFGTSYGTM